MKNLFKILFYLGVVLFFLNSCEKESNIYSDSNGNIRSAQIRVPADKNSKSLDLLVTISQSNGVLIFNSEEDFESSLNYFMDKSKSEIIAFVSTIGLESYSVDSTYSDSILVDDFKTMPYFFSLLSKDGIIKIANRLYRLDFVNKNVVISPNGNFADIPYLKLGVEFAGKTLVEKFNSDIVYDINFSNKDSLRDENDSLSLSYKKKKCHEKPAHPKVNVAVTQGYKYKEFAYRFKVRAEYSNYGVFHVLGVKIVHQYYKPYPTITAGWYTSPLNAPELNYLSSYSYKVKCKPVFGYGSLVSFTYYSSSSHLHPYYSGTRRLHTYDLHSLSGGKGLDGNYYTIGYPVIVSWP